MCISTMMCYVVSVSYFNDICFYTMMGGLVSSFLSGMVYDWQKKVCKSKFFSINHLRRAVAQW